MAERRRDTVCFHGWPADASDQNDRRPSRLDVKGPLTSVSSFVISSGVENGVSWDERHRRRSRWHANQTSYCWKLASVATPPVGHHHPEIALAKPVAFDCLCRHAFPDCARSYCHAAALAAVRSDDRAQRGKTAVRKSLSRSHRYADAGGSNGRRRCRIPANSPRPGPRRTDQSHRYESASSGWAERWFDHVQRLDR